MSIHDDDYPLPERSSSKSFSGSVKIAIPDSPVLLSNLMAPKRMGPSESVITGDSELTSGANNVTAHPSWHEKTLLGKFLCR